jgi:hypothetical protein
VTSDLAQLLTRYLSEPADAYYRDEDPADARHAIRLGQPLFAFVAALAARREVTLLDLLYSGHTRLHAVIDDEVGFRDDRGFAERSGAPFRPRDNAGVHATRALAGLGLALTGAVPAEGPLNSALNWYTEARGSLAVHQWDPRDIDWGQPRLAVLAGLLATAASHDSSAGAALTTALTLRKLTAGAQAAPQASRGERASVTVLLVRSGEGVRARLQASVAKGLPPGLTPDPRQMALFSADQEFQRSLDRAWTQTGAERAGGTVLWSIRESEGPSPRIEGGSAGAALASVLDEVRRLNRPLSGLRAARLQSSTAIVGRIGSRGYLQGVEGYDGKLAALGEDSRVIVPAADAERARSAVVKGMEIVSATRWPDAARKARQRNGKVRLRQGLAVMLVLAVAGAGAALATDRRAVAASSQVVSEQQQLDSDKLAAQSQANDTTDPTLARLEAVAAWHLDPTQHAKAAVLAAALLPATTLLGSSEADTNPGRPVAFSPDGRLLAAGTNAGVELWPVATQAGPVTLSSGNAGSVTSLAFSPVSGFLAVGTEHGGVQLWDTATRTVVTTFKTANDYPVVSVAFSPDGRLLAVGTDGDGLELWAVASRSVVSGLGFSQGEAASVAFSQHGDLLAVGAINGSVELWNTVSSELVAVYQTGNDDPFYSVAFSPDSSILAVSGTEGNVQLWDVATGRRAATLASGDFTGDDHEIFSVAFSRDGRYLAAGDEDGTTACAPTN